MISQSVVLQIPSWFPNDEDPFAGDFIVRHLEAIQGQTPILAVHLIKDPSISNIQILQDYDATIPNISILLPSKNRQIPFIQKWNYKRLQSKAIRKCCHLLNKQQIKVLAVHSHVLHPAASIAKAFKKHLNCPWIHTEHWSALTKENGEFERKSGIFRRYYKSTIKHVDAFTFVSKYLNDSFAKHFSPHASQSIISNTVDTSLFNFREPINKNTPLRFLHVSSLGKAKQAELIIEAFLSLGAKETELWVVGGSEEKNNFLRKTYRDDRLQFLPPQSYDSIAILMQDSDALVLNSLYETQSCVAIEALCCGLPVIAPAVAALPEFLNEQNSILFNTGEIEIALKKAITLIPKLDKKQISNTAIEHYSYSKIGKDFKSIYSKLGIL